NITPSQQGLDLLLKIPVYDFNYIFDPEKQRVQGFVAQDLYEVYPQVVTVGGDDPKTQPWQVDYGKMTPLLVRSVQDIAGALDGVKVRCEANEQAVNREIASLKSQLEAVKEKAVTIERKFDALKAYLCKK